MAEWLIWLIAAGALAAAESATLTFVLLMFSGGALAGSATAAIGAPVLLQVAVALIVTMGLVWLVRPVAIRHLHPGSAAITGSDALVGREAIVLSEVDARDGRVRLNGGEWSARTHDQQQVLPAGTVVRVLKINGATAVVAPDVPIFDGGLR